MKLLAFMLVVLFSGPLTTLLALWWIGRRATEASDEAPGAAPGAIPDVAGLTRVEHQWFYDAEVPLDGYHFYKCRFDRCELLPGRGQGQLTLCVFNDTSMGAAPTTAWGSPVGIA